MEVLPRSSHSDLNKQAALSLPEQIAQKNDIAKLIANVVGLSAAGGILARLGLGASRSLNPKPIPYNISPEANVIPIEDYAKEEEQENSPYKKEAASNPMQWLADIIHRGKPETGESGGILSTDGGSPMVTGGNATGPWGIFGTIPAWASIPAGLATAYGGYKLTDYILDKRRKAELEDELDDVKQRYEEVAARNFDKESSERSVEVDASFDALAEYMTQSCMYKQALFGFENPFKGVIDGGVGMATGGYGAYALLASLLAGYGTHSLFKGRSDRALIEQALKERQKSSPSLPYATYETPDTNMEDAKDDDEEVSAD